MQSPTEFSLLRVRLTPKGGRDALSKWEADTLYARVAPPPADGAANRALIDLLSKSLGVSASQITFVRGNFSRDKLLRIEGLPPADLNDRIERALQKN